MGRTKTDKKTFFDSCDTNGQALFSRIFEFAEDRDMPIVWGDTGFSLNTNVNGDRVNICLAYPPHSVNKQSIITTLRSRGNTRYKAVMTETTIQGLWQQANATGFFVPAGRELKCEINRKFTEDEIDSILVWCIAVDKAIWGIVRPTDVEPRDSYRIWLHYSDGVSGEIDLSHLVGQGVFEAWNDRAFFETVYINPVGGVITWNEDIDLCPDALYMELTGKSFEELTPGIEVLTADA